MTSDGQCLDAPAHCLTEYDTAGRRSWLLDWPVRRGLAAVHRWHGRSECSAVREPCQRRTSTAVGGRERWWNVWTVPGPEADHCPTHAARTTRRFSRSNIPSTAEFETKFQKNVLLFGDTPLLVGRIVQDKLKKAPVRQCTKSQLDPCSWVLCKTDKHGTVLKLKSQ